MDKSEALRSIDYDLVEYIQQKVQVDFDNADQRPISFKFSGKSSQKKVIKIRLDSKTSGMPYSGLIGARSSDNLNRNSSNPNL